MNLIVDIGNSRAKLAVMHLSKVMWSDASSTFEMERVRDLVAEYPLRRAIVCSTRGDAQRVVESLRSLFEDVVLFDSNTPIPIKNSYSTPDTLGRDRLAAAVGASVISTAGTQLIIDMGTAITIDLVTRSGGFEGGVISPGVEMRFRALNNDTAALPKCEPTEESLLIARSTRQAIEQGVMRGVEYELRGHIEYMKKKFGKIDVIFAGGDAKYFDMQIKNAIFAPSDLVFVGLNIILEYNAK